MHDLGVGDVGRDGVFMIIFYYIHVWNSQGIILKWNLKNFLINFF